MRIIYVFGIIILVYASYIALLLYIRKYREVRVWQKDPKGGKKRKEKKAVPK